jgi:hypothetical protein
MDYVPKFHMVTFSSLLIRSLIARNGSRIILTSAGEDAYSTYASGQPSYRMHESNEISERVENLLRLHRMRLSA